MSVQAQYASNVLQLNRGLTQEGQNNYTMQPRAGGGGYIDQPHLLFDNINAAATVANTNNPRKRNREMINVITNSTTPMNSIISSSMQSHHHNHHHHLMDLAQPNTPCNQNVAVSTGLRLAFGDQQQLQNQPSLSSSHSSTLFSLLSEEDFVKLVNHQRTEIQQFLLAQGDLLRRKLTEKRQRHYRALLGAAEESVARKLIEKDIEVEKAARRNAELQARAAQLSAESEVWQARAKAQEATAAALQAQLQQAIMSGGVGGGEEGCGESGYIEPERVELASGRRCKGCGKQVASVVLLPCRHLCVCAECDGVVQACPLCLSFRSSSVEVFLS